MRRCAPHVVIRFADRSNPLILQASRARIMLLSNPLASHCSRLASRSGGEEGIIRPPASPLRGHAPLRAACCDPLRGSLEPARFKSIKGSNNATLQPSHFSLLSPRFSLWRRGRDYRSEERRVGTESG